MPTEFHITEESSLTSKAEAVFGSGKLWDEFRRKFVERELRKSPRIAGKFLRGPSSYDFMTKTEPAYRIIYKVNDANRAVILSDIQIVSRLMSGK
jgi:mRNA-degrading endonuclease RelE of RelBE toxin-antitoxin system